MMKHAVVLTTAFLAATAAWAQNTTTNKTPAGQSYLQTPAGQALYVYDNDKTAGGTPGPSTCTDQCATVWPPFMAAPDAAAHGAWGIDTRKDGAKQWTYKGRPLYTFVRDTSPGKIEGDGFDGNKWHLAEP